MQHKALTISYLNTESRVGSHGQVRFHIAPYLKYIEVILSDIALRKAAVTRISSIVSQQANETSNDIAALERKRLKREIEISYLPENSRS